MIRTVDEEYYCVTGSQHEWEHFIADGNVPYYFCRECKSTLYCGRLYPLKDRRAESRARAPLTVMQRFEGWVEAMLS